MRKTIFSDSSVKIESLAGTPVREGRNEVEFPRCFRILVVKIEKTNSNSTRDFSKSQGHIVWEYRDHGKGRKLIVPEISSHIWNYFPIRTGPEKHLSNSLTFVAPDLASHSADLRPPSDVCPKLYIDNTTDPMCPHFPEKST